MNPLPPTAMMFLLVSAVSGCRNVPMADRPGPPQITLGSGPDPRVVIDRLQPRNNAGDMDLSALNAVGVVAPVDYAARRVFATGTGYLIDACHVLTAQHVMYGWQGDYEKPPVPGQTAQFALGQTRPDDHNQTEGLKSFYQGAVTAQGGSGRHGGRTDHSNIDWAVITLSSNVTAIAPLPLVALDPRTREPENWILNGHGAVGAAGFPGDHMNSDPTQSRRDLWGSYGEVLTVSFDTASGYASMTSTNAATAGTSGGALFAVIADRVVAVGIVQSVFGDGVHDKADEPTVSVLITPALLEDIETALRRTPCPTGG